MKRRGGFYPRIAPATSYVYLTTLQEDFPPYSAKAQKMLYKAFGNRELKMEGNGSVIELANAFLEMAAQAEEVGERAFMASKGITLDDTTDIKAYIEKINDAIIGIDEYKRRLEYEISRWGVKGTGSHSYTQAIGGYVKNALQEINGEKVRSRSKRNSEGKLVSSFTSITRKLILKTFSGAKGITSQNLAGLTALIQTSVLPQLEENRDDYLTAKGKISEAKVKKAILANPSVKLMLENDIALERGLDTADKIVSSFKLTKNTDKSRKRNLEKTKKKLEQIASDAANNNDLLDTEKKKEKPEDGITIDGVRYSFNRNTGIGGEAESILDGFRHTLVASVMGKSGGKIDSTLIIGELTRTPVGRGTKEEPDYITKLGEFINSKTTELFAERGEKFKEIYDEMNERQKQLDELKQSFILHENIKDYMSTATDDFSGFDAGSWSSGGGVMSFINAITALDTAGFSPIDVDLLITMLVNCAPESLGAANKSNLQKYLSIYGVMLLFDDGVTMAQNMASALPRSNLSVLHLFKANGVYMPASALLRLVKENMEKAFNDISSNTNSVVSVNINPGNVNFQQELYELSEQEIWNELRWVMIREKQIAAMKISLKMTRNFVDIINTLSN